MDRRGFLGVGAAGIAVLAGCSAGGERGGSRTVNPALRGTPTPSPTPTPEPPASETEGGNRLDEARSIVLSNRLVRPARVLVQVQDSRKSVLETVVSVPGAGTTRIADVLWEAREYAVNVRTGDGRGRTFEWTPPPADADLGVDLGRDVGVRDRYDASAARGFVEGSTGGLLVTDETEAVAPFVVDNPGPERLVRVAAAAGDGYAGVDVRVPAGSTVPVLLSVPRGEVAVAVETAGGRDHHVWRPAADGALFCRPGAPPRLLCDLLVRDVVVANATDADAAVDLTVRADGVPVVDRTIHVTAGGRTRLRAAVPPAGAYVLDAAAGDRETRTAPTGCPPAGPFVVRLTADAITATARTVDGERTPQNE